jgi:hypothetical protein
MNKSFFFPFQRVTDADLNFIETSKEEAIKQQTAFILAKFNHQFSGSIPVNLRQSIQDILINPNTYRGIGGGYGSDYLKPVTGSVSSISINRGWAITDGMDIIILSNPVTINQGDNTFNKSWGTLVNGNTAYVTIEYQQSSSSVGNDAQGNTYYKRYFGDYKIVVSSTYPSNSNQVPLATFIANGNLITPGTFQDVREWARPWGISNSIYDINPIVQSLATLYDHTHAIGTGNPTVTNPHGLSLNDLGFVDSVSFHRKLEHGNGIIISDKSNTNAFLSYSGSIVSPTSNAYIAFNPPFAATASINGVLFSGSIPSLSSSGFQNGNYWVVVNQNGQPTFIATSSINFDDNNILINSPYLLLGKANIADNGDDITSYEDLRRFYTMQQTIVGADIDENIQNPSLPLYRYNTLRDNLDRLRYQIKSVTGNSNWKTTPETNLHVLREVIGKISTGSVSFWNGADASTLDIGVGDKVHGLWNQFSNTTSLININIDVDYQNMTGRTMYVTILITKFTGSPEFASFDLFSGGNNLDTYKGQFAVGSATQQITLKGFVAPGAFFRVHISGGTISNFNAVLIYTN